MDYKNIDTLLNKYFEGLTSLQDEKELKRYFSSDAVQEKHKAYQSLFVYFGESKNVTNPQPIRLSTKRYKRNKFKIALAASLLLGLGILGLQKNNIKKAISPKQVSTIQISNPEKQKESVKEIKKYTKKISKGIKQADALSIFGSTTKKVFNIKKDKKEKK